MRLRELFQMTTALSKNLELGNQAKPANPTTVLVSNINVVRSSLNELLELGICKNEISKLLKTVIFAQSKDQVSIATKDLMAINQLFIIIKSVVINLTITLSAIIKEQEPETISVKLPNTTNLIDLEKTIKDINLILSQTILDEKINGKIELRNFDSGTLWLEIFLGSALALQVVAGTVWSASVVYKKMKEAAIFNEYAKSIKIKNESSKDIQLKQKEMLELIIRAESENLYSKYYKGKEVDNEQINRLVNSVKLMAELIQKGTEIHPALSAPENVSNLFPNFKQLDFIETQIGKLNKKN